MTNDRSANATCARPAIAARSRRGADTVCPGDTRVADAAGGGIARRCGSPLRMRLRQGSGTGEEHDDRTNVFDEWHLLAAPLTAAPADAGGRLHRAFRPTGLDGCRGEDAHRPRDDRR